MPPATRHLTVTFTVWLLLEVFVSPVTVETVPVIKYSPIFCLRGTLILMVPEVCCPAPNNAGVVDDVNVLHGVSETEARRVCLDTDSAVVVDDIVMDADVLEQPTHLRCHGNASAQDATVGVIVHPVPHDLDVVGMLVKRKLSILLGHLRYGIILITVENTPFQTFEIWG